MYILQITFWVHLENYWKESSQLLEEKNAEKAQMLVLSLRVKRTHWAWWSSNYPLVSHWPTWSNLQAVCSPSLLPTTPSVSPLPHINQRGPAPSTILCSALMQSPHQTDTITHCLTALTPFHSDTYHINLTAPDRLWPATKICLSRSCWKLRNVYTFLKETLFLIPHCVCVRNVFKVSLSGLWS